MNINATRRLHFRFSPESKIKCYLIWQVFWLGFCWTPSRWFAK